MAALVRTQALLAALGEALGVGEVRSGHDGATRLTISARTEIRIYGGDDETIVIESPVAPMPRLLRQETLLYLFRNNSFSSESAPFQIAADHAGMLVFWGRLWIEDLDGPALAGLIEAVADRVLEIREVVIGDASVEASRHSP